MLYFSSDVTGIVVDYSVHSFVSSLNNLRLICMVFTYGRMKI